MSSFKYKIAIFFMLICFAAHAQQNGRYTLQQCIDIALQNNFNVKTSEAQMQINRVSWQQARENLLPGVSGDINNSINNGRSLNTTSYSYVNQQQTSGSYSLSGSVILFNGLALQNSIKQASLAYQAGKMDYQQAKDLTTLNVITTYLQVLNSQDQLTQATYQVDVAQKQAERQDILGKEGAAKPGDISDIKGAFATSQLAVINAKNTVDIAKLSLLQIMNVPYDRNIQLEPLRADELPVKFGGTSDDIYASALTNLPSVKAAAFRRQSAEKGVSAAKGGLFPTLSLSGGLGTSYSSVSQSSVLIDSTIVPTHAFTGSGATKQTVYTSQANYNTQNISFGDQFKNNFNTYVSLGLHIPILNYFRNRNNISLAKINLFTARFTEETIKTQLKQNIDQAYVNMVAAYDRYQVTLQQVSAYTESFRTAEIRFNEGVLTSVDYVLTKNNMDQANINLISARYDYFIRTKILDYYQGKLTL
ncbi:N/A [soil metagenome]|jgi:outer membrane protein